MTPATVIIPAHNEAGPGNVLGDLIRACYAQSWPIAEVIVVADGCTDDTAALARQAGATVVETAVADKASAQNEALALVRTEVVVGFDADTVPQGDCIARMMAGIDAGYDAVCATILPIQPYGFFIRARRFAYALARRWWRACQAKVGRIQVLTGAAYAFRTEAIRSIGGFPRGLISADMDLTWELHRAGYRLGYSGDAVALTRDPETLAEYRAQMRRWASGYFQAMAKHRQALWHWRSVLVVWTAIFDLICLFWAEAVIAYGVLGGHTGYLKVLALWVAVHALVNIGLVTSVVGLKEAMLGVVPYFLVNFYNKWLYFSALVREWVLGRHYTAWTGRHGREPVITPMSGRRRLTLTGLAGLSVVSGALLGSVPAVIVAGIAFVALLGDALAERGRRLVEVYAARRLRREFAYAAPWLLPLIMLVRSPARRPPRGAASATSSRARSWDRAGPPGSRDTGRRACRSRALPRGLRQLASESLDRRGRAGAA